MTVMDFQNVRLIDPPAGLVGPGARLAAAQILVHANKTSHSSILKNANIFLKPNRASRRIIDRSPTPGGWVMSTHRFFDRLALAASLAVALFVSAFGQGAFAQSAPTFRDIHIDVQPLRANAGDPTATWVQEDLPRDLAQALAGRMSRDGAPLTVRIDYLTLGPQTGEMLHAGASLDNILGVAVIGGRELPVRATTSYYTTPVDQTMIERSNRERVAQLSQALAFWIARGDFF
jgi:hypothetical protein